MTFFSPQTEQILRELICYGRKFVGLSKSLTMRAGAENMDEFEAPVAHMLTR